EVSGGRERGGRGGLAGSGVLPVRRLLAAQRRAAAAPEAQPRPLLRPRLRDHRLRTVRTHPCRASNTHLRRSPGPSSISPPPTACSSTVSSPNPLAGRR